MRPFTPPNAVPRQVRPVTSWNLGDLVSSDELEVPNWHLRSRGDLLASSCNTNNGRHAPSLVAGLQRRSHDMDVPCGVKGEIQSTIGNLYQVVLDPFPAGELRGVHELGGAHLNGPISLSRADINGNDARSTDVGGCRYNPEADGTAPKDSDVGALCKRTQRSVGRCNGGRSTH